jgi:hypothetical protein
MMSLRLNLLSPDKRKNFTNVVRFLFIKEMLEFLILTVTILALMYLFAWWIITNAMIDVVQSALLINRETPPINRDIRDLNTKTRNLNSSSQDFVALMPRLSEFFKALPDDIKLVGIDLDRKKNSFVISGTASTRDALLNFQKIIGSINWVQGVTAPTSQLFQKENISFEIRGTLKGFPPLKK